MTCTPSPIGRRRSRHSWRVQAVAGVTLCLCCTVLTAGAPPLPATAGDCAPLLSALLKARLQPLVSQYLVDDGFMPVALEPMAFRVRDLIYETENGVLVAHQLQPGQDRLVAALEAELAAGRAWCRDEGDARYFGLPATKVSFRHPDLAEHHQPATVLIDRAEGLPRWHGYASMSGGFAWVYDAPGLVFPPLPARGAP